MRDEKRTKEELVEENYGKYRPYLRGAPFYPLPPINFLNKFDSIPLSLYQKLILDLGVSSQFFERYLKKKWVILVLKQNPGINKN